MINWYRINMQMHTLKVLSLKWGQRSWGIIHKLEDTLITETKMHEYVAVSTLLERLGYVDPCPNRGRNNKAAMKLRKAEIQKLDLDQYRIGTSKEYQKGGGYIRVPIYEYQGIKYSQA